MLGRVRAGTGHGAVTVALVLVSESVLPAGAAAVPAGRRAAGADCGGLGPGGPAAAVPAAAGGRRRLVPHRRPGRGPRLAVPHGRLSGPDLGPVRHRRHGCRTPRSGRHGRPDTPGPHRRRPCRRRLRPLLAGAASRVRCRRSRPGGQNGIVDAVHVARQRRPLRRPHRGPAASAVAGYGHGPGGVGAARGLVADVGRCCWCRSQRTLPWAPGIRAAPD